MRSMLQHRGDKVLSRRGRESRQLLFLVLLSLVSWPQLACESELAHHFCEINPLKFEVSPPFGLVVGMDVTITAREGPALVGVDWSLVGPDGTISPAYGTSTVFHPRVDGDYIVGGREPRCGSASIRLEVFRQVVNSVSLAASATVVPLGTTVHLMATEDPRIGEIPGNGFVWAISPAVPPGVFVVDPFVEWSDVSATFRSDVPGDYVISVASVLDSSKTDQVTINVQRPVVSVTVVAPSAAEMESPILLEARVTKSIPSAPDGVTWSVSPADAVESLVPTGPTSATLVGRRPHTVLTVSARSTDVFPTEGTAAVELTPRGCLTELPPLGPAEAADHLVMGGRIPLLIAPTGLPIVGSIEADATHVFGTAIHVRRATTSGWETLGGGSLVSGTEVDQMAMAKDLSGEPVVAIAYFDQGLSRERVNVQRWDGARWVNLGMASGSSAATYELSLAMDVSDHPLVAWQDRVDETKALIVSRWDFGTDWDLVARVPAQLPDGTMRQPQLVLDAAGTPVLSWDEAASDSSFHRPWSVRLGGAVTRLGSPDPSGMDPFTSAPSVAIDGSGAPVVVWVDYPDSAPNDLSNGLRIHRFSSGTSWTELGGLIPMQVRDEPTAIEALVWNSPRARLALTSVEGNAGNGWVREYDGNSWTQLCSALVDAAGYAGEVFATGLAPDPSDGYWMAARAASDPNLVLVQRVRPPNVATPPPAASVSVTANPPVTPTGGTTIVSAAVTGGVGPFSYEWRGFRDDGSPFSYTISNRCAAQPSVPLIFPGSDFYIFVEISDCGDQTDARPAGTGPCALCAGRRTGAYVRVHEADDAVARFTVSPGPIHANVDAVHLDASASSGVVTPIGWTLQYLGDVGRPSDIEGWLKLQDDSHGTLFWNNILFTTSDLFTLDVAKESFASPGAYRMLLQVNGDISTHQTYEYFYVDP